MICVQITVATPSYVNAIFFNGRQRKGSPLFTLIFFASVTSFWLRMATIMWPMWRRRKRYCWGGADVCCWHYHCLFSYSQNRSILDFLIRPELHPLGSQSCRGRPLHVLQAVHQLRHPHLVQPQFATIHKHFSSPHISRKSVPPELQQLITDQCSAIPSKSDDLWTTKHVGSTQPKTIVQQSDLNSMGHRPLPNKTCVKYI